MSLVIFVAEFGPVLLAEIVSQMDDVSKVSTIPNGALVRGH